MAPNPITQVSRAADKAVAAIQQRDRAIVNAHTAGQTLRAIADAAGLSHSRVHQIVNGK